MTGLFSFQHWQLSTFVLVGTAVFFFLRGWTILPQAENELKPYRRLAFLGGMVLILLIIGSPIYHLATQLFSVHVGQHILLMALIPCLINLSDPLPIIWGGVSVRMKTVVLNSVHYLRLKNIKAVLIQITNPGSAFVMATVTFWIWYDPQIHQLTRQYRWVHALEVTLLLSVALLYWWHILEASPHVHRQMPPIIRILYTIMGTWPIKIVGLILLFSNQNVYQYPDAYQFSGLNINDQGVGAIIVWALGGFVFSSTATLLARDWLNKEANKPIDPSPDWQNEYKIRAPGFRGVRL